MPARFTWPDRAPEYEQILPAVGICGWDCVVNADTAGWGAGQNGARPWLQKLMVEQWVVLAGRTQVQGNPHGIVHRNAVGSFCRMRHGQSVGDGKLHDVDEQTYSYFVLKYYF